MDFENLIEVLDEYGRAVKEKYQENIVYDNAVASGELLNSVKYILQHNQSSYEVSLSLLDYWKYLENGRKAGKFPPINKILDWIRVKPVLPRPITLKNPEESMAYAIRNKIIKKSGGEKKPPISAIKKWMDKNNIEPSTTVLPTERQLAFLISRKIALEGTKPRDILKLTLEEINDEYFVKISDALAKDVEEDIDNFLITKE